MQYSSDDLKRIVNDFLAASGMKPTRFGKSVNNDPSLVSGLRAGRDPRASTIRKILGFIQDESGQAAPKNKTGGV